MDEKARKDLINSLAVAASFDPAYSEVNRRWMVGKMLSVVETRVTTGDAAIKAKVKDVVTKSKALVKKYRDFKISIKINSKEAATERGLRSRRVQILYGMIAFEPELALDPLNEKQLSFVARRRYRAIARFQFYINPNGRGYLRYPSKCPTNQRWRVNVDADPYWVHLNATDDYPLKLVTPPNPPDIVTALEKFFIPKSVACDGNLFDCATALSIVYMDSLLEAKTPKIFLEKLYARDPPMYLSIDHVHLFEKFADLANSTERNKYFIMDVRPTTLFNKTYLPQSDLQVGDHVYIYNHSLYRRVIPNGAWRGEHALLTDCGNRQVKGDSGYRFMGHGMPRRGETGGVTRFYGNLLNELNSALFRLFRIGGIFLFYKKSGDTAFPGKVTKETGPAVDSNGNSQTVDFYFFNLDFKYRDSLKKPPKGKSFAQTNEHGFVAWHIAATREFGIHEKKTIAAARAQGIKQIGDGVRFTRLDAPTAPAEMFDSPAWSIPYPDNDGSELLHFLFQTKGAGLEPLLLEMWELYSEVFAKLDHPGDDILTTQPQVDVSSAYNSFLTSSGGV